MVDAFTFLTALSALAPGSCLSIGLSEQLLTVTIAKDGKWFGYHLDANDLKKPVQDLAIELHAIHVERARAEGERDLLAT